MGQFGSFVNSSDKFEGIGSVWPCIDGGSFWLGTKEGNKEKVLSRSKEGANNKLRWASGRWFQQSMDLMELDAFRGKPVKSEGTGQSRTN